MSSLDNIFGNSAREDEGEHWLTVSDLMAGLMMVFLFIAIAFMRHTEIERNKIRDVAVAYQENQVKIYEDLMSEFSNDLENWEATIDNETLSFQFNSPEVLFDTGESTLKPEFESILSDFIPRYLGVLEGFIDSIDEVRIEGHTSSEWGLDTSPDDAYFFNMTLSQNRTRSVLNYAYMRTNLSSANRQWIKSSFAAVGMASSRLKYINDCIEELANTTECKEDQEASRRVSFRVITNADIQIRRIIEGVE
jgi:outer membrane protein OmpA-like peptidoglycan-associated protein